MVFSAFSWTSLKSVTGQLVPESTRTQVKSYPFWSTRTRVNSYPSQLVPILVNSYPLWMKTATIYENAYVNKIVRLENIIPALGAKLPCPSGRHSRGSGRRCQTHVDLPSTSLLRSRRQSLIPPPHDLANGRRCLWEEYAAHKARTQTSVLHRPEVPKSTGL